MTLNYIVLLAKKLHSNATYTKTFVIVMSYGDGWTDIVVVWEFCHRARSRVCAVEILFTIN